MTPDQIEARRIKRRDRERRRRIENPEAVRAAQLKYAAKFVGDGRTRIYVPRANNAQRMRERRMNAPEKVREWRRVYNLKHGIISGHCDDLFPRNPIQAQCHQNELYAAAAAVVPRGMPDYTRDDIIADIVIAVLTDEITIHDIPKCAKKYISAHYKMFSHFGPISLDALRFDDGRSTLHDVATGNIWEMGI